MGLKKVENIQKYSGKRKMTDEENNINSKENVEKIEDAKDEINEIPPIMQIDYDELPDGVYDFVGLAELQNRKTRPNLRENEKILKNKSKKEKKIKEKELKKRSKLMLSEDKKIEEHKNIVEEIFEEKRNVEENNIIEEKTDIENLDDINTEALQESKILEAKNETQELEKKDEQIPVFENNVPKLEENFKVSNSKLDVIETQKFDLENKKEEKNLDDKKVDINIEESNLNGENYFKSLEIKENKELVEDQINIPEAEMENFEKENRNSEKRRKRRGKKQKDFVPEDNEKQQEDFSEKITSWFAYNKKFAFCIMLFLGVLTQISFLATNRENNLIGLLAITLSAISMFLLVNVLDIKNKILIFLIALALVLIPEYSKIFITGENAITYSFAIVLALFSLNLVFVKKNKIISFVLAVTIFAIGYKIFKNCMEVFLVVSIIKIIEEIFNQRENIFNFLIHCMMICAILAVIIFL